MASKRFKGTKGIIQIPLVLEDAARLTSEYKAAEYKISEIQKDLRITVVILEGVQSNLEVCRLLRKPAAEAERIGAELFPLEVKYGRQRKKLIKAQKALARKKLEIKEFLTDSIGFEFAEVGDRVIHTVASRLDELQKLIR